VLSPQEKFVILNPLQGFIFLIVGGGMYMHAKGPDITFSYTIYDQTIHE